MDTSGLIALVDLTSLNQDDTPDVARALCRKAQTPFGAVAAVCVYPFLVKPAKQVLANSQIKVATVVNFPAGEADLPEVIAESKAAMADGADEIDMVIPLSSALAGNQEQVSDYVRQVKNHMGERPLKVILETGLLQHSDLIIAATRAAIAGGADFIKTSTGKIKPGATLPAAQAILATIKDHHEQTGHWVGFKASGGIKTKDQVRDYLDLARATCGEGYLSATTLRFGASSLIDDLLARMPETWEKE